MEQGKHKAESNKRVWICALLAGVAVGAVTVPGKFLPPGWNLLADSAALWMVAAFFVASTGQSALQAIGLAMVCLVMANTVYYPLSAVVNQKPVEFGFAMAIWYAGAVAAGCVFGAAAWWWRSRLGVLGLIGAGMPAAVLWAETAMILTTRQYTGNIAVAAVGFGLGVVLLLFCGIRGCKREHTAPRAGAAGKRQGLLTYWIWVAAAALLTAMAGALGYKGLWLLLG